MQKLVEKLLEAKKTVATMESCTGGGVADAITNISGASEVLKFSAVTYSNEYKILMGVSAETIDKYSVYSSEVAMEMAKAISNFAKSDYGIGITGKLNRADKNNLYGEDNQVFVCIYDKTNDYYDTFDLYVDKETREFNKQVVIDSIEIEMMSLLNQKVYNNNKK